MSVWCSGEGVVCVPIKEHISINKVFDKVFKGCDKKLSVVTHYTHESKSTVTHYQHTLKFSVDLDAQDFILKWKEFVKLCKFCSCDIDLNLRWYM